MCDHFIYPGYRFSVVDCLVTNFHIPKSSLILLVSAFAGRTPNSVRLPGSCPGALPLLQLRGCNADPVTMRDNERKESK